MPRVIEVVVSPQGETTVQTKGYAGADCLQASKFLEQALGVVAADRKTAEFYQPAAGRAAGPAVDAADVPARRPGSAYRRAPAGPSRFPIRQPTEGLRPA